MTALATNGATEEARAAPDLRCCDRSGTLIRHAVSGTMSAAIGTLTIAMVETSPERLLVSTIGLAVLLSSGLAPASWAAVALSPIAAGAKVEDRTTAAGAAEPLSENNLASDGHVPFEDKLPVKSMNDVLNDVFDYVRGGAASAALRSGGR